ncbi:hypothetical protein ACTSKR_08020 [Chitinibacteraceae bacterium HSL-7]
MAESGTNYLSLINELPRKSDVTPYAGSSRIIELNEESLQILDGMEEYGPFNMGLAMGIIPAGIVLPALSVILFRGILTPEIQESMLSLAVMIFVVLSTVIASGLVWFLRYRVLIQPSPAPMVFDRKRQMVFGSLEGKPVAWQWSEIKPFSVEVLQVG